MELVCNIKFTSKIKNKFITQSVVSLNLFKILSMKSVLFHRDGYKMYVL